MSSLAAGFAAWMRKRAESAQGETTLDFEVPGGKRPKRYGLDEVAQKSSTVITADSPERAFDALSALKGAAQDAFREACASLENGAPVGGPLKVGQLVSEAPFVETIVGSPLQAKRSSLAISDAP